MSTVEEILAQSTTQQEIVIRFRQEIERQAERIAELGRKVEYQEATIHSMSVDIGISRAEIGKLEQKLRYTVNALDRADGALIKMRD